MKRLHRLLPNANVFLALVVVMVLTAVCACKILPEKKLYGDPTPIPEGQSALDVVRTIQDEFMQLKKPILKRIKHHKQWKKRRFADSTYTYGPFEEVILTREAYDFYKKHTTREIFTAVTPLLFDPDIGGEVAVLLSGIPAKNRERASRLHVGRLIKEMGYVSPENKGGWDISIYKAGSLIGYPGIYHDVYENPPEGTLDHAVYSVLKEEYNVRNHPRRDYFKPFASRLEGKTFQTLDDFIETGLRPKLTIKFEQFLVSHSDLFSSTVLLASVRNNTIALMWSLDLEDEFWPLAVNKALFDLTPFRMSIFKRQIRQMETDFIQTAGTQIYQAYEGLCD